MSSTTNNPIRKTWEIIQKSKLDIQEKNGISIITLGNQIQGFRLTKSILYKLVDKNTALFLSGGLTPKHLYQDLALEKKLRPGAVAMVDEKYWRPNSKNSNERMIRDTGLLLYLKKKNIPFYRILRVTPSAPSASAGALLIHPKGVHVAVSRYERVVGELLKKFKIRIAVMGVGRDGHTAGIAPNRTDFSNPLFEEELKDRLVSDFNDDRGYFKERITITFNALSKLDLLLVLVFGKDKKSALKNMFKEGSIEEIPARFYKKPDIAKKTILITDQRL